MLHKQKQYDWMQVMNWKIWRTNYFDTLQLHIHNCGNASSLKNVISAKHFKKGTSWQISSPNRKYVIDWETLTGCTRSSFQEVILYTSATATSSSTTLNSINAKSQTIANKSWKHEIRITLWVSSLWVSSTSTRRISFTLTSSAYVCWTKRFHSEAAQGHNKKWHLPFRSSSSLC